MVGTIVPAVRRHRIAPYSYAAGAITGSLAIGVALGGAGRLARAAVASPDRQWIPLLVGVLPLPLLERRQQVPSAWRFHRRRSGVAFGWGFLLGTGVLTHLMVATLYVPLT